MKPIKPSILIALSLVALSVYLFATAPPPLVQAKAADASISIEVAFKIVAAENDYARELYTREIVGEGKKHGLKFDEHWQDQDLIAAPLPAQFLRETSRALEQDPVPLGLFLGSDYSINSANNFEKEFLEMFAGVRENQQPIMFYVNDAQRYAYLAPDVAVVDPCVKCHNEHKDSPKVDWEIGDVMGATTWTYPNGEITHSELLRIITALRNAFSSAYQTSLNELSTLENPPVIGDKWPREGYYLPSLSEFERVLGAAASSDTLSLLLKTHAVEAENGGTL